MRSAQCAPNSAACDTLAAQSRAFSELPGSCAHCAVRSFSGQILFSGHLLKVKLKEGATKYLSVPVQTGEPGLRSAQVKAKHKGKFANDAELEEAAEFAGGGHDRMFEHTGKGEA